MATREAYVQVKGLKKHYGDGDARLTVLDGIDTSINRGEICVMLGPVSYTHLTLPTNSRV